LLVSVGPVDLPSGGEETFAVLLVCGNALSGSGAEARGEPAPAGAVAGFVPVWPNPVRLAWGQAAFGGLRANERVSVYSVSGQLVRRLESTGSTALWSLDTAHGAPVSAGTYFYRVDGPSRASTGKIVVVR
jgi:hypothetical protein